MRSKHKPELPKKDLFALGQLLQSPWTIFHLFRWRSFHLRFSNFVFLLKLCLIFTFSGLVLFHCWNRLLSKLIFNGFVKFKNQIQSIKVCQGNWLCIVCTAHSSTASNISSIFHPSHLISHLHQYLQQLIFIILFAPMYFDARKRLPRSVFFCDNIFLQPKIMQNVGSKCKM